MPFWCCIAMVTKFHAIQDLTKNLKDVGGIYSTKKIRNLHFSMIAQKTTVSFVFWFHEYIYWWKLFAIIFLLDYVFFFVRESGGSTYCCIRARHKDGVGLINCLRWIDFLECANQSDSHSLLQAWFYHACGRQTFVRMSNLIIQR